MKALRVLRMVRQKEQDNDEVKYSDYDIREAVNEVLRYLNVTLSNKGSDHLQKTIDLNQTDINTQGINPYDSVELFESKVPLFESEVPLWAEPLTADYDFAERGIELPPDFVSMIDIQRMDDGYHLHPATSLTEVQSPWGEKKYLVMAGRIFVKGEVFRLRYNRMLVALKNMETDEIDLPDVFIDSIVKLSRLVLNNADVDTMTQAVTTAVDRILPRRQYTNIRQRMPFYL